MSGSQCYIQIKSRLNKKNPILKIHTFFRTTAFEKVKVVLLFFPAFIFLIISFITFSLSVQIKNESKKLKLPPQLFSSYHPAAYPMLENAFYIKTAILPSLSAKGVVVMDSNSKVILLSKNMQTQFSMASTTKIMSALVALDYYKPTDTLTIQSVNSPPAVVGYALGEEVRFIDILYGMMLPSGNDAALTVAQNYHGGVNEFISEMNKKARKLSLSHTHFSDSSGLDDVGDYTTVLDLAWLASEAIKNPLLADVVSTKQKLTTNVDNTKPYYLTNINELLGKYGVNGVKTGFTPQAGGVLVTSADQGGHIVIIVIMKSEDRFRDTEKILSALNGNITYLSILP